MNKSDLDKLVKAGRIRGYTVTTGGKAAGRTAAAKQWLAKPSASKSGFKMALMLFCVENHKPLFQEQQFHETRKWRIDFLIPGARPLGIEYEGIYSEKSRHTTLKGFAEDGVKYRAMAQAGITMMRFTANDWKTITQELTKFYN